MESKKKGEKTVGDKVRQLRSKMGLTQDQLARQCDIPYTTLTKLESNVITKPSIQTVGKIAKGLDMTIDDILK
jgi:DNA-binding XRE family transcriptional regulator